jgi:hypothetical protein
MKRLQLCLALCLITLFAGRAQGQITWATGYPKASNTAGQITIQGNFNLPKGYTIANGTLTVRVWLDGKRNYPDTVSLNTDNKSWGPKDVPAKITLGSGQTYNVTVEIQLTDSFLDPQTFITKPARVTVK